jgi:hypothetical protein
MVPLCLCLPHVCVAFARYEFQCSVTVDMYLSYNLALMIHPVRR